MPSYSFYLLDSTGATYDYLVQTCVTDQAARERAMHLLSGSAGVEVWRAKRLVGRLNPLLASAEQADDRLATGRWFERPARVVEAMPATP